MRRTPALIVGGGPAGASVAILLARAAREHLLIERTPTAADALCGGFLSWRTLESLRALGIDPNALNPVDITTLRLFAGGRAAQAPLPQPSKGVSRRRLDSLMLEHAAEIGAKIERGVTATSADPRSVTLRDGGEIAAEALFLATGKHDLRGLARPAEARGDDPTLGLRVRLGPAPALQRLIGGAIELHLFDRGYAGLVLQEDGSANLCMAVHRSRLAEAGDPESLLAALGDEQPMLGERLAWRDGGAIDAVANVPYGWRAREGASGLFRLGDQAGVIPSLAGEGMGIAVASGIRAAHAYLTGGPAAAPRFQLTLARDLARPMAIAGGIRRLAESRRTAPWMVGLAAAVPGMAGAVARLTRINHSPNDEHGLARKR